MSKTDKMQEKKNKIMECALELYSKQGYLNTPVRDIIDITGYGTSTFYRYFNNKEDVLKALLNNFLSTIISNVNKCYDSESDLYTRFIETKRVMVNTFIKNRKLSELYARIHGISNEIEECLHEFEEEFMIFVRKNLQYGIRKGIFQEIPIEPVALGILGIIKHAVYKWTVTKDINSEEMVNLVISFHESLANGIVKK